MLADFSRAFKVGIGLLHAALFCVAGCDRVPDVVVRVLGVPKDTQELKASLWQLRVNPDGSLDPNPGSPIPAFQYTAPALDPNQLADSDPNLLVYKFGLRIPDDEGVLYSVDVAAFQKFGTRHCLLGVTQPSQADGAELRRGTINLPQEFSVLFDMESAEPKLQPDPNADGRCLADLDTDTHPIVEGLHLTFDQSRSLGDSTTALVNLTGWNIQPGATIEAQELPDTGPPIPRPFPFPLQILSPSRIAVEGIPAQMAIGLIGKRISFIVKNPDGQTSVAFVTKPIQL